MLFTALEHLVPVTSEDLQWPNGMRLRLTAYLGEIEPPPHLVTSVRCVVSVGDRIVAVSDADGGISVCPGGRCEPGESWHQTARREVREETGAELDEATLRQVGLLHFHHLNGVPEDHPYPHPDFLQVVMHGRAPTLPEAWDDHDGYVTRAWLVPPTEVEELRVSTADRAIATSIILPLVRKVVPCLVRTIQGQDELLVFDHPTAGTQIPKGTVERGEDPESAALRELAEETGVLDVELVERVGTWVRHAGAGPREEGELERHEWEVFLVRPTHPLEDTWTQVATGSDEEKGLEFACRWIPLNERGSAELHPLFAKVFDMVRDATTGISPSP